MTTSILLALVLLALFAVWGAVSHLAHRCSDLFDQQRKTEEKITGISNKVSTFADLGKNASNDVAQSANGNYGITSSSRLN